MQINQEFKTIAMDEEQAIELGEQIDQKLDEFKASDLSGFLTEQEKQEIYESLEFEGLENQYEEVVQESAFEKLWSEIPFPEVPQGSYELDYFYFTVVYEDQTDYQVYIKYATYIENLINL